jgi:hypothetical protein
VEQVDLQGAWDLILRQSAGEVKLNGPELLLHTMNWLLLHVCGPFTSSLSLNCSCAAVQNNHVSPKSEILERDTRKKNKQIVTWS